MTKEEYQNSDQYKELLNSIKDAIEEKSNIQNNDSLSEEEKAKAIAKASDKIMRLQMNCSFYIHKDYFLEFEEGRHTTIDISNSKVKFTLGKRGTLPNFRG